MAERSNTSSTSSLTLPTMPGTSPDGGASPRRAVSPLLEVRRPHCTLNCETCNAFLEDLYRHSRSTLLLLQILVPILFSIYHFFSFQITSWFEFQSELVKKKIEKIELVENFEQSLKIDFNHLLKCFIII